MPKTTLDVVTLAYRRIGVSAVDETLTADEIALGGSILQGIVDEITATQGLSLSWTANTVPDELFLPMAYLTAVDLASFYEVTPRDSRARLICQVRAVELPDDREDRRDINNDGTISDDEVEADGRAVYY